MFSGFLFAETLCLTDAAVYPQAQVAGFSGRDAMYSWMASNQAEAKGWTTFINDLAEKFRDWYVRKRIE